MPTISQLRYILAVQREGHFGRAAEKCGVAQPTLSAQIQKTEEELGVVIFDRLRKPVEATRDGLAIVEQAQTVVASHEQLMLIAEGMGDELAGEIELGIIPTLSAYVLPWFLASFAKRYPAVSLNIHELTTEEIVARIKRQSIDAAILATPLHENGITEHVLFYDPFYLYANAAEGVLEHGEISAEDLDPTKIWLLGDGHCFRVQMLSYCSLKESCAHFGSVTFVAGGFDTLRNLIDASGGYTLIPETYARTLPKGVRHAQVRPFADPIPTREVSLVHHKHCCKTHISNAISAEVRRRTPRALRAEREHKEVLAVY